MKKKLLSVLLTVAMAATLLVGCGGENDAQEAAGNDASQQQDASEEEQPDASGETDASGKKVTALFISLEGEYFTIFDSLLKEGLEEKGYTYESQSCNMDAVTMIEQIENAVAGGTDLIWMWAPSGEAVSDACKAAREQGVMVYAFIQDPGEASCDVFRGTDEKICGESVAEMASEWADKEYADAEDGAIKTVIFGNTDSSQQKERFEAIQAKIAEDTRFEVLEAVAIEASTVASQTTTENMFSKYGDIDCFITTGGEFALGVLAYTHSEGSPITDPTSVAVFGTELNEELASYIKDGSLKGTIMNGGIVTENIAEQIKQIDQLLKGEEIEHFSIVDMGKVTSENLTDYGF